MKPEELISMLADHMENKVLSDEVLLLNGWLDWQALAEEVISLVQPQWISVEEKLPENYSFVLCSIKSPVSTWVEVLGFGDGVFQLDGRPATPKDVHVTHWMEKPQPAL